RTGRPHLDPRVARVVLPLADPDVVENVRATVREDLVQHLGQDQRVDDVAVDLDLFDERGSRGGAHDSSVTRSNWRRGPPVLYCTPAGGCLPAPELFPPPRRSTSVNISLASSARVLSSTARTASSTGYSMRFSSTRLSSTMA